MEDAARRAALAGIAQAQPLLGDLARAYLAAGKAAAPLIRDLLPGRWAEALDAATIEPEGGEQPMEVLSS